MSNFIRYVLLLLLACPPAFAQSRYTAHEPVFFSGEAATEAPTSAGESKPVEPATAEEPAEVFSETGSETPDEESIFTPATGTRSTAERTGAIHYAPAQGAESVLPTAPMRNVRFELGVRSMGVHLTDDKKGEPFHNSFIGSIYKLKAKQNWLPIHPFAQLEFALPGGLWLGAGATYSHLDVETLDDGGGDGDIESDILLAYALLEYPVERLRPYAEAGYGRAFNTFDAIDSWSSKGRREFVLEDSPVWMVGGGLGVALTDHFTLDAHVRYVHFDVDGTYVFRGDSRPDTDFTFTPSYIAAGLGISYAF